jgi:penicillin-binding protein 1C
MVGGSTLTMQTIRLSRHNKPRTIIEKLIEIALATRAEIRYSKKEILQLFAGNAPFGGNPVGLDAACWRYFGRPSNDISWAEAAMLAVLPNSPS